MTAGHSSSVDAGSVRHFEAIAAEWWDPKGSNRALHWMTPVRVGFIRDRACRHFGRDPDAVAPLQGLTAVDVACGGGLLSEPIARLGAAVTGIDAGESAISVAKAHAARRGLSIDYRTMTGDALAAEAGERFDLVLALEIIEHVTDPGAFVASLSRLARPGGLVVVSTLNRTPKSFGLAIVGAEYLLGWVPKGSHQWRQFVRPEELCDHMRTGGLTPVDLRGMVMDPLSRRWSLSYRDLGVNYIAAAAKPTES